MAKMILGILLLASLSGCEQSVSPIVGSWSYNFFGTVTYTFNADNTCSVTAPDAAGGTRTTYGTYTFANVEPPQLQIWWKDSTTGSMVTLETLTPLFWNQTTSGLCISLEKQ